LRCPDFDRVARWPVRAFDPRDFLGALADAGVSYELS